MVTVNNATKQHFDWIDLNTNLYGVVGEDIMFGLDSLKADAKLEELLNIGAM